MVKNMIPKNVYLRQTISQIQHQMRNLGEVSYYHVFRKDNGTVDKLEKVSCFRPQGEDKINEEILSSIFLDLLLDHMQETTSQNSFLKIVLPTLVTNP